MLPRQKKSMWRQKDFFLGTYLQKRLLSTTTDLIEDSYLQKSQGEGSLHLLHYELAPDSFSTYCSGDKGNRDNLFSALFHRDLWDHWHQCHAYRELWNSLSQRLGFFSRIMFLLLIQWVTLEQKQGILRSTRIHSGHCQHAKQTGVSPEHCCWWEIFYWFTIPSCTESVALDQQFRIQWQCHHYRSEFQLCEHRFIKYIWCSLLRHQSPMDLWEEGQMSEVLWPLHRSRDSWREYCVWLGQSGASYYCQYSMGHWLGLPNESSGHMQAPF